MPFCASRCGYCDFNTYVGMGQDGYADAVLAEWALAQRVLGGAPPADTVFVGGGTPTLLSPGDLARILAAIPRADGAEVTVEANPETVDRARLEALRAAGATRLSLGMQSAVPHVLAMLDRVHTPGAAPAAARLARDAGFAHVSLDLIYGTPGETDADWAASLDAVVAAGVDHVSAYPLVVEPGTRLRRRVRRGELPAPDGDAQARRYRMADAALTAAGLRWYEICNWAATPGGPLRAQPGVLALARLVGPRPGRALARRRRPLVERPPSRALRRPPGAGALAGGRARADGRRAAAHRAHDAADPARRGAAAGRRGHRTARRACSTRPRSRAASRGSRSTGGCWPTTSRASCC